MKQKNYIFGRFAYKTDIGKVRLSNEDQANAMINQHGNILLLVCDGMGGQNKGDFASQLASKTISEEFRKKNKFFNGFTASNWVRRVIQKANKEIYSLASENEIYKDMGTTLSLVLIVKNTLIIAQIGDSRVYSMDENKKLTQLSEDQTYVGYLYRTGQITKEEMSSHPKRHMLMNALGVYPSASAEITIKRYRNETLLLCSDGLYNNVPDNDIASIVRGDDTTEEKITQLIGLANSYGGSDNIAVVIWEASK